MDVSGDTDGHHHPSLSTTVRNDSEKQYCGQWSWEHHGARRRRRRVCVVRRSMQFTPPPRTIKPISAPSDVSNWPVALPPPCYSLLILQWTTKEGTVYCEAHRSAAWKMTTTETTSSVFTGESRTIKWAGETGRSRLVQWKTGTFFMA